MMLETRTVWENGMKIYLSPYWIKSSLFMLVVNILSVVIAIWFYFNYCYHDKDSYILFLCLSVYILIYVYCQLIVLKLLGYVKIIDNKLVMYSLRGKQQRSIYLTESNYYQIVSLVEGTVSVSKFIIISEDKFPPYPDKKGLITIYKSVYKDKNKKQIIVPYKAKQFLDMSKWIMI